MQCYGKQESKSNFMNVQMWQDLWQNLQLALTVTIKWQGSRHGRKLY